MGAFESTLTIAASPGGTLTLQLQGRGLEPGALTLEPAAESTADYGDVLVGEASVQTFVVTATGEVPTGALAIDLSDAGEFMVVAPSGSDCVPGETSLDPAASCTVGVAFQPSVRGAAQTVLTVSGPESGGASLSLSAVGRTLGSLASEQASLSFGDLEIGNVTTAQTWTITNVGENQLSDLTLRSSNAQEFATIDGCTGALLPHQSCEISVTFSPQSPGTRMATLDLEAPSGDGVTLVASGNAQVRLTVERSGPGSAPLSSEDGQIECGATCSALYDAGSTVRLRAETTNGSNTYFSGWSACRAPSRTCEITLGNSMTAVASFAQITNNLVFTTSEALPANLGSPAAYDIECNRVASNAGLNNLSGNGYIAAVSSDTSRFSARLGGNVRGWIRLDGLAFGTTIPNIVGGAVYNPVAFDEEGNQLDDLARTWAGTHWGNDILTANCAGWTTASNAESGTQGNATYGPYAWMYTYVASCDSERPVLCLGNTSTAALTVPQVSGRRIWLSSPFRPGTGETPDERCLEDAPNGAGSAVALISGIGRAASELLDPNANYVRVDGQLVGTGADIIARTIVSGVWQLGDGTYPRDDHNQVWVGSDTPDAIGDEASTCDDWTSDSSELGAPLGNFEAANVRFWGGSGGEIPCDVFGESERIVRLYCIEP